MHSMRTAALSVVVCVLAAGAGGLLYLRTTRLDARATPAAFETRMARMLRHFAVPPAERDRRNPIAASPETVAEGMEHFADHCAVCHANDGSGDTEMGRGLFPKPPDMRGADTQSLYDGELFHIIEHGVRFTGMPGWGNGGHDAGDASWRLVLFVRHLPRLTPAELDRMAALNPRSPEEIRQELEEEQFLRGDPRAPAPTPGHEHTHGGHP